MTLSDALEKAWADSDAWEASAQANYLEACRHRKAAEDLWLALQSYEETEILDQYKEYANVRNRG